MKVYRWMSIYRTTCNEKIISPSVSGKSIPIFGYFALCKPTVEVRWYLKTKANFLTSALTKIHPKYYERQILYSESPDLVLQNDIKQAHILRV